MTPFEQAAAIAYGSEIRCLIAGCGLDRIKRGMRSNSHFVVHGKAYWMSTTASGIELQETLDAPKVTVPWGEITSHIRRLPESLRAAARAVDHDAHRPPASQLEWRDYRESRRATEAQRLAHLLWADSVTARTAHVLTRAFPESEHEDLDLFTVSGLEA